MLLGLPQKVLVEPHGRSHASKRSERASICLVIPGGKKQDLTPHPAEVSEREGRAESKKSLQVFLEVCREKGIEPRRSYSGRFNLRISPELHERLAILAQAEGKSINAVAQEALQQRLATH